MLCIYTHDSADDLLTQLLANHERAHGLVKQSAHAWPDDLTVVGVMMTMTLTAFMLLCHV